jgi:hypothetical protein
MKIKTYYFDTEVDGKMINIKATRFAIATKEIRFRVSYNGGRVHLFAWDEIQNRFVAIKENVERLPQKIESAVATELLLIEHKNAA